MNYPKYNLATNTDATVFEFVSEGTKGTIVKAIVYTVTDSEMVYNLGFGDKIILDEETGEIDVDDSVISDNGDRDMVLATVAKSAYIFTEIYPERALFFMGSTVSRTRLYRMAISKNFEEISKTFSIFGAILQVDGGIVDVPFDSKTDFYGFLIKRK
ncbi:hypothetical protein Q765_15105 [Flavobacterium rivuli WB 3.3-2 = DSM 21788]|uniref:Uncharacterized protein n=1 Tax=Flavobacterium rivuli WB 3.3-2 = DSM 21788 TaxID=1121895 RepID=A0A0A2LZG2_9FLAO|nr:hypothetical protein [Flavobacterium rivuli]KGO85742.1 hypothetical protein Q765_15105 [Flavobacterium rivuli WB 3.3-2 = DSM 21788]